uniref:Uncharacterized protein n=1 Tax=Rhipicephalus zambeziensis TaxID=60191 RepID=A0A224Y5M8_9ACAR
MSTEKQEVNRIADDDGSYSANQYQEKKKGITCSRVTKGLNFYRTLVNCRRSCYKGMPLCQKMKKQLRICTCSIFFPTVSHKSTQFEQIDQAQTPTKNANTYTVRIYNLFLHKSKLSHSDALPGLRDIASMQPLLKQCLN